MERFNYSLIKPSACIFFYCEQLSVMHQTLGFKGGITDISKYSVSGTELKCTQYNRKHRNKCTIYKMDGMFLI